MIKKYNNFIDEIGFGQLSENVMIKLTITEFSNMFESRIFESESDSMLLEKSYAMYELGMLYESKKDWFADDEKILMLESELGTVLFKNGSAFIIDNYTMQALSEGIMDDISASWEKVKSGAKSTVDLIKSRSSDIWNSISDGAKKVYLFTKKIVSALAEMASGTNFWTIIAIVLQVSAAIVPLIPAAGQLLGPTLLGIAGGIEIGIGVAKMKHAWGEFSEVDLTNLQKAKKSLAAGLPYMAAGTCSIVLGLNDVIMAPSAAVPGVAGQSVTKAKVADAWAKSFAGQFSHGAEHFLSHTVTGLASKLGAKSVSSISKFMGSGGSAVAASLISTLFLMIGEGFLGKVFDGILFAGEKIGELFQFLLALPEKFQNAMSNFIKSAKSPAAKIIAQALESFIGPALGVIKKLVDNYIKPIVQPMTAFLLEMSANHKAVKAATGELESKGLIGPLPKAISTGVRVTKGSPVDVDSKDAGQIKKLNKKTNEGLDYLESFENFASV